ncbi:testis-expressed protein 2 isoform X2 [Homalodisca vitripennis]|nr:testis-expressed protein 2 isoform X2 [Homalodisca vitripennis]
MNVRKRSPSAGVISSPSRQKGLAMSSSVSNISFRYHPEDEELEDIYDTSSSIIVKSEGTSEDSSVTDTPSRVLGRLGIREETDKWKLFREVKGRITKSVEEKIEEIKKTDRLKSQNKQRRPVLGMMEQSSVSDSEEQSESSQPASDKSTRSTAEPLTEEQAESDASCSTPERSTTPVPSPSPEEVVDEDTDSAGYKGKGIRAVLKRKKGKTKIEKDGKDVNLDKSTISFSSLCDKDSDSEVVEVAQEVRELPFEGSETELAKELDRLANPTLFRRVESFVYDWHIVVLPLIASLISWLTPLPQYIAGVLVGALGLLMLQKLVGLIRMVWGYTTSPIEHFRSMLPLHEVPIFRRSVYESDIADTVLEGWMNEYGKEYRPETYHVSLTETVYVTLDGTKLKLSSPRCKVPKRSLWNEPRYKLLFNRERLYDITNCRVEIKPDNLIHRRIWSKKYPICITLTPASKLGARHREKNQETVDKDTPWIEEEKYNFDTISEDSDDDRTVPSVKVEENSNNSDIFSSTKLSVEETVSVNSELSTDLTLDDKDKEEEEDFVCVTEVRQDSQLYLFARTDREKEIWYRRLTAAARSNDSSENSKSSPTEKAPELDYLSFMLTLSQRTVAQLPPSKEQTSKNNSTAQTDLSISMDMMWLNAFLGRLLYDVFQDPEKLVKIQEKIQKKLSAIKLPLFLEKLEVSHLELGQTVPIVQRAMRPTLNAQGIWVDLDIVYEGGFKMIVDTKVNLNRLRQMQPESPNSESPKSGSPAKNVSLTQQSESQSKRAVYDSSVEDSAETSSEELESTRLQDPSAGPVKQHKYLRILGKVAQSKYFQQVIDYKFIKKFVNENNLQLIVEVKGLLGTLVLNIPPPPSDRLWYGFRTNPKLWLSAQPKVGQRQVHVISRIIEKKLSLEFQRLLVLPNMDDLLIPLMDHRVPS